MKILIIGKNSQIGKSLYNILKKKHEVKAIGREDCDLSNELEIQGLLKNLKTDLIINSAAYTNVEEAESNSKNVFLINSNAVKIISIFAKEKKIPTINFSTDYVFDGMKSEKYVEDDKMNPLNIYGKSKMLGEENAKINDKHIIIRTSRVFSPFGSNFINKIIDLAEKKNEIKIINDQIGTPTSSEFIAKVIYKLIEKFDLQNQNDIYGVYHIVANGSCSWHDYAQFIVEKVLDNGFILKSTSKNIQAISSEDFESNVIRPKNSILSTQKIKSLLSLELPEWKEDVKKTIELIINNK